jgi:membrane protease YdiL (CAAX protease family)
LAVVIILAALQLTSRKRWYFNIGDYWPMVIECILLAIPLIVLSLFLNGPAQGDRGAAQQSDYLLWVQNKAGLSCSAVAGEGLSGVGEYEFVGEFSGRGFILADIITGMGAGIYEELVFRLILICLLMVFFQDVLRFSQRSSIILSVLISAALFSAHHHIVFLDKQLVLGTSFNWTEFGFRTVAGIYFAVIFAIRGFGITAGTHAFYDIIAVLINTLFFGG